MGNRKHKDFLALPFKRFKGGLDLCEFPAYSNFKSFASRIEGKLPPLQ